MPIHVKLIGALRHLSGKKQLTLSYKEGTALKDAVEQICREIPALKQTFSDQTLSDAKSNSLVLINGKEISVLDGYETLLSDGDEVVFVPVIHGG
jgi:MoaD family protein